MRLNAVIIEDEMPSLKRLKRQLNEISPEITVIAEIQSVAEGMEVFPDLNPDVIISDIELGDGLSFDLFKQHAPKCPVIFATAYNQYAIESFRVNAVDYLLKPIGVEDLRKALQRINVRQVPDVPAQIDYDTLAEAILRQQQKTRKRFLIKIGTKYNTIESGDIAFAYTEYKINYLVNHAGKHFPVDQSLEQLEQELDPDKFFRINRSFMIGIDAIDSMHQYSKGRIRLRTKPEAKEDLLIVGTEKSPKFRLWLEGKRID